MNTLPNKYQLTLKENIFIAKKSLAVLIHSLSRLENVKTTFPQTQTLLMGRNISGVSTNDIQVILNLKNVWPFLFQSKSAFNLDWVCKINGLVAYNESIDWGVLRTGQVYISNINDIPPIPNPQSIETLIQSILNTDVTLTHQALKLMYQMMRGPFFWDGNKRTAILSANCLMMRSACGIIHINENQWEEWHQLLSAFYETGHDEAIILWTYEHAIYGIDYSFFIYSARAICN